MENLIEQIQENASREYDKFREKELSKNKEAIYKDYYIINFYEEVSCFITESDYLDYLDEDELQLLHNEGKSLIGNLFYYYLKHEYESVSNWEHIEDMINDYISLIRGD